LLLVGDFKSPIGSQGQERIPVFQFSAFIATLVDGMGIANAIVIRAQALMMPIRALVF